MVVSKSIKDIIIRENARTRFVQIGVTIGKDRTEGVTREKNR